MRSNRALKIQPLLRSNFTSEIARLIPTYVKGVRASPSMLCLLLFFKKSPLLCLWFDLVLICRSTYKKNLMLRWTLVAAVTIFFTLVLNLYPSSLPASSKTNYSIILLILIPPFKCAFFILKQSLWWAIFLSSIQRSWYSFDSSWLG